MNFETFLLLSGVAFLTSILSSIAGFGGGILVVLFFSFFFEIKLALALSGIYFLFGNLNKIWLFRHTIDWDFLKLFLGFGIPGCVIGLYFFQQAPSVGLHFFLFLLGVYLIYDHFFPRKDNTPMTSSALVWWGGLWGMLTGFANALFLRIWVLRRRGLTKHFFVGTGAAVSLPIDIVKVGGYTFMGLLTHELFFWMIPLFFVSWFGTVLGKKVLDRISVKMFEWIVLGMIFVGVLRFGWMTIQSVI